MGTLDPDRNDLDRAPHASPPTGSLPETHSPPATGSDDYWDTELTRGEEPMVTSTLFFVMIILMIIAAFWITIYLRLLDR